ncbi:uncharacterized protein LOC131240873 isoform X1 [Magnolia sinica]|uniref:uncharacterized protein LOC131240873 isoform X1 n=1 Tax=Magnolia sinica TaxID=86752 RepID=UPI002658B8F3|nr:uncharacterized protein LOC131240873 isoform X1 [Magnolia sinica]XP_058095369.1 uncharacterized protein LOC131240873 isoform X1 [Magnolia sinica]
MPLIKNKVFALAEPPEDLRPEERVWQVRFTKEIFRSYEEYLQRVNLYRQRVWKCKVTGKIHLTYEEALVSEHQASERIQQFPKEFMEHVLRTVQFSTLNLHELVKMVYEKLKDSFIEGEELHGRNGNSVRPCKILKILTSDGGCSYRLGRLDKTGKAVSTSTEDSKNLMRKKLPFGRDLLKLFIRESTSQNDPWVVYDKLAMEHGISTEPPEELREKIARKLKTSEELKNKKAGENKRTRMENDDLAMAKRTKTGQLSQATEAVKLKYPIDDLLVKPSKDDPVFSERPVPSTNFIVPVDYVGDLLMVWDFCSSFGKLLRLSPFSFEKFENAIVYEGPSNLIVEIHTSILNLLVNDRGEYYSFIQKRERKEMVTSMKWVEYLCDFLELETELNSAAHLAKIKHGLYYMLGVHAKLEILGWLVYWALSTDVIRGRLDKYIDEQQALVATKREEELEEKRKKREEKQLKEMKSSNGESLQGNSASESLQALESTHSHGQLKDSLEDVHMEAHTSNRTYHLGERGSKHDVLASRRAIMKQILEAKVAMEREKETVRMVELRKQQDTKKAKVKEAREKKEKEQRQQHFEREMEKRFIRTDALGKDRDHNRYWFLHQEGRVFIESADHNQWGFYASKEELDGLMGSLNPKGERELDLHKQLQKHYLKICAAMQKRSKETRETAQRSDSDTAVLRRSVRVSVLPNDNKQPPFLRHVNKWMG